MLWLLKKLIFGHVHRWREVERANLKYQGPLSERDGVTVFCECETCGAHRKFNLF